MGLIKGYDCDNCGVLKGKTNHWWTLEPAEFSEGLVIGPFIEYEDNEKMKVYCGRDCLYVALSKFLDEVSNLYSN